MCFKDDTISRQAAIDVLDVLCQEHRYKIPGKIETYSQYNEAWQDALDRAEGAIFNLPSAQPEHKGTRIFQEIIVKYPSIYVYPDYRGKPYFSIKYTENGQEFIGYGTYKPEVLSEYLKEYFIPSAQPEQRWIPVTERLPDEKDAGILKKFGTSKRSEYVLATVEVKGERMTVTACTYDGEWHWDKKYAFPDYEIVAWMPLPEPYREDGNE